MIPFRRDCTGATRPSDYRRPVCLEIVVHRNTVADKYRQRHPEFTGDSVLATALFHREAPEGTPEHFRIFPYHFFVDRNADPWQCLPYNIRGQHAKGRNTTTVAVAIEWDCRISAPPDEMIDTLAHVCAQIRADFGYPPSACAIVAHDPLKPCPGLYLDLEEVQRRSVTYANGSR